MFFRSLPVALCTFISTAAFAFAGSSWNAFDDFWSTASNFTGSTTPNTWSYGTAPSGNANAVATFSAFGENNLALEIPTGGPLFKHANSGAPEPCVARANAAWYPGAPPMPPFLFVHPGENSYAIVRWKAPEAGTYKINATFLASGESGLKEVGVVRYKESGGNVEMLKPTLVASQNPTIDKQAGFKESVKLEAGEFVAFYVGNGGDTHANDAVGLEAVIASE
jgi:hypothetical protein